MTPETNAATALPSRLDVEFHSGSDTCAAWLYLPVEAKDSPVAGVVMAHGLGATRNMGLEPYAERFRDAGLAVLVFDYRFFGDSGGEPRQLLDIKSQHEDWASAIKFMRGVEQVDPARVGLFGTSFSGGHVIKVAAEDHKSGGHKVRAVVSQCPFMDGPASSLSVPISTQLKIAAIAAKDLRASLTGKPPVMIDLVGHPGQAALMTSPDAYEGYTQLQKPGAQTQVAARIALKIGAYRPGASSSKVGCPIMYSICTKDALAPASAARRSASKAPISEVIEYDVGHFDIYVGEDFEKASVDQATFLAKHLAPSA